MKRQRQDGEEPKVNVRANDKKIARQLDQFFTTPQVALECIVHLHSLFNSSGLSDHFNIILEPSFGQGAFLRALDNNIDPRPESNVEIMYCDVDAVEEEFRLDFLSNAVFEKWPHLKSAKTEQSVLTIGNPPFGKMSSLAVAFFNRAATFSNCIAFIVPRTFSKASVQNKLTNNMFLISETVLQTNSFIFAGNPYDVPCVFQVWMRASFARDHLLNVDDCIHDVRQLETRRKKIGEMTTADFVFVRRDAIPKPDIAIRRVGVNAGRIFETKVGECSEQSHYFIRVTIPDKREAVIAKLKSLDLEHCEVKFQTAGNPSISKSELCALYLNL